MRKIIRIISENFENHFKTFRKISRNTSDVFEMYVEKFQEIFPGKTSSNMLENFENFFIKFRDPLVTTQALCGGHEQGGAVSVGPIWHACTVIRSRQTSIKFREVFRKISKIIPENYEKQNFKKYYKISRNT